MEMIFDLIFGTDGVQMAVLPILAIVGLAAAAAGATGTAVSQNKKRKKLTQMQQDVEGDMSRNKAWYSANALSDYTQRADAQNLFKNLRDNLKRNRDVTTSTAAITGATPAAVAASKEADTKAISDVYGNVAAMGQQYKDNVTNQYFNRQAWLRNAMLRLGNTEMEGYQQISNAWSNLAGSGLNAAAGAFGGDSDAGKATASAPKAGSYGKYYGGYSQNW
jgi:hypothetical protein